MKLKGNENKIIAVIISTCVLFACIQARNWPKEH